LNKHIHNPYLLALVTDNNAGQSFESSIVRRRVMAFEGWRSEYIVTVGRKPKRFLIENRLGFDWLPTWFFKLFNLAHRSTRNKDA